jgi:hypothetical protein
MRPNIAIKYRCHSHGNQLELWAAATKLPLHQAAMDLLPSAWPRHSLGWALVMTSSVIVPTDSSGRRH